MNSVRRWVAALLVAVLAVFGAACSGQVDVNEDGIQGEIEGNGGEGGEGGEGGG